MAFMATCMLIGVFAWSGSAQAQERTDATLRDQFCHAENGRDECAVFKFVMVWRNKGADWQVARALSFDHR